MLTLALALVLLPGLVVVRAPWTAVAPLSLALWALSAWWPPFSGAGRGRLLVAALAAQALLAAFRLLPKHEVAPPPGWRPPPSVDAAPRPGLAPPPLASAASLVVLGIALALLAPLGLWPHAPGPRLAFQTTAARLVVWRDSVPRSLEPLVPLEPFGAHAPALATLAADASLLTGVDPAAAVTAVVAVGAGLALIGLFALIATWAAPWTAAAGALAALALPSWPAILSIVGAGESLLALGFALPAAALLVGHASRASAVASALLLAASALAQPALAAVAGAVVLARAFLRGERGVSRRVALALVLALVLAAPGLLPLLEALSAREALAIASAGNARELPAFLLGLALAALVPRALARRSGAARVAGAAIIVVAAPLLVVRVHAWFAAGVLPERTRAALARAAAVTPPLATLCAADGVRDFVPALAGRRAGEPGVWIPAVYAEEWTRRDRVACDIQLSELSRGP
jgi:hypothetical protein